MLKLNNYYEMNLTTIANIFVNYVHRNNLSQ
jgi:hypothetical protein